MELGVWSIVREYPSLLGLIPMILYIILAFKKGWHPLIPLGISIFVGWIITGNTPTSFGKEVMSALGSNLGSVALLLMEGAGLSVVLNRAGVSSTLCKFIVDKIGVNTQKKGILVICACQFIIAACVGSCITGSAIVMPILLPMVATVGIAPVAAGVALILSGLSGMLISPFAPANVMGMTLSGLSYPQYLLFGAGPYLLIMVISGVFITLWINKKALAAENPEVYNVSKEEMDLSMEITPEQKRSTIAFVVSFFGGIAACVITGGGIPFTIFIMPFLAAVVAVFAKMKINDTVTAFIQGCKDTVGSFIVVLLYQVLVDVIGCAGGFEALGDLLTSAIGGAPSQTAVMLMGTLIGAFGVNGGAAAQMQIINDLFMPMIKMNGLDMRCWAIVLIAGSWLTTVIYPNVTILAPLEIARSNDFKRMMICMWLSSAVVLAFCVIAAFVLPLIV